MTDLYNATASLAKREGKADRGKPEDLLHFFYDFLASRIDVE
jgi:hypothetical protein